jgi:hypothetical protein
VVRSAPPGRPRWRGGGARVGRCRSRAGCGRGCVAFWCLGAPPEGHLSWFVSASMVAVSACFPTVRPLHKRFPSLYQSSSYCPLPPSLAGRGGEVRRGEAVDLVLAVGGLGGASFRRASSSPELFSSSLSAADAIIPLDSRAVGQLLLICNSVGQALSRRSAPSGSSPEAVRWLGR